MNRLVSQGQTPVQGQTPLTTTTCVHVTKIESNTESVPSRRPTPVRVILISFVCLMSTTVFAISYGVTATSNSPLPTTSRSNVTFNEICSQYNGTIENANLIPNGTHLPIPGYNTFGTCKYNKVTYKYGMYDERSWHWCPMPGSFTFDGKCYSAAMLFAPSECGWYAQCTLNTTYQAQTYENQTDTFLRSATCDCSSPHEEHSFNMEFTLPPRTPDTGANDR